MRSLCLWSLAWGEEEWEIMASSGKQNWGWCHRAQEWHPDTRHQVCRQSSCQTQGYNWARTTPGLRCCHRGRGSRGSRKAGHPPPCSSAAWRPWWSEARPGRGDTDVCGQCRGAGREAPSHGSDLTTSTDISPSHSRLQTSHPRWRSLQQHSEILDICL